MNLINTKGLNCYYGCIVSIADYFGIDYRSCYSTLWSENDFLYDQSHSLYLTNSLMENLKNLGLQMLTLDTSSPKCTLNSIESIAPTQIVLVGMDTFYIPWSSVFKVRHRKHFFFGIKTQQERLICFDPTYIVQYASLPYETISTYAYDLRILKKIKPESIAEFKPHIDLTNSHLSLLSKLLKKTKSLINVQSKEGFLLAKYVDRLIDNRYLFKECLKKSPNGEELSALFPHEIFAKWIAVKNGYYKSALTANNAETLSRIIELLNEIISEEISISKQLSKKYST